MTRPEVRQSYMSARSINLYLFYSFKLTYFNVIVNIFKLCVFDNNLPSFSNVVFSIRKAIIIKPKWSNLGRWLKLLTTPTTPSPHPSKFGTSYYDFLIVLTSNGKN